MEKIVFVPLTDELLYDNPERIIGPIIPFSQRARQPMAESVALNCKTLEHENKTEFQTTAARRVTYSTSHEVLPLKGRALR